MGAISEIEWTDATWNPVTGCTKVSPGCDHCYAERVTERFHGKGSFATVQLHPDRLDLPLQWRKPRKVFVNSMSDLFHDQVPDEFIARVFAVMFCTPRHTFQVLTKRHARLRSLLNSHEFVLQVDRALYNDHGRTEPREALSVWPLPNVWLGVSVENQQWADIRIPALLETPAAVRFLSCEPLLGPVDLSAWLPVPLCDECDANMEAPMCNGCHRAFEQRIGWCIVGGESGPGARPMHPQWARDIRDQCNSAGVPFLFKQWGEWAPTGAFGVGIGEVSRRMFVSGKSHPVNAWMDEEIARVGKKAAGRELDGRTWDEYPA